MTQTVLTHYHEKYLLALKKVFGTELKLSLKGALFHDATICSENAFKNHSATHHASF